MEMCQSHWDMLRQEIDDQGMSHLVSGNNQVLEARLIGELKGDESRENLDVLMRCWTMIMTRTMDMAGLASLSQEFGCPICTFNQYRNSDGSCPCTDPKCGGKAAGSIPNFETWIKGSESCVTSVKEMVVQKGWL